jgi:glycosyltransferase involved in cell wall biosynthesis
MGARYWHAECRKLGIILKRAPMRIAQVAPLYESVPPKLYGGTERVVSYLTEALVEQGHEVTLFGAGDSKTEAELISIVPRSLRLDPTCSDSLAPHVLMLEQVIARAYQFDVVHFHVDYLGFPFSRRLLCPSVTTLHGRLDQPHLVPVMEEYADMPLVSISNAQRTPLRDASWSKTIYHGLPTKLYNRPRYEPGEYFAFIGRISPEKRVDRAIEVAKQLGVPLKIAAKVDAADKKYYEAEIKPLLDHPLIEYIGEIGDDQKCEFLSRARALLFLIDWPEPFGLAMIEAMACGTPVVAFRGGSVPEVVDPGITGYIVQDMAEAVHAASQVHTLDRRQCRAQFERRFSASRMAGEYADLYATLIGRRNSDITEITQAPTNDAARSRSVAVAAE